MTQSRRPNIQRHCARPAAAVEAPAHTPDIEEEKIEYIDFINTLMHRMRLDGVKRMLEAAHKEADK